MDKEYIVLEEINENQHISQRQLAEKTGLSLGSINLLLKKMLKEGLIKIESIPANRVIYMLTPQGMVEKANKTYKYIKYHYRMIEETKRKIKNVVTELLKENETIHIILREDEISGIVRASIEEIDVKERILVLHEGRKIEKNGILLTIDSMDYEKYKDCDLRVINLGEKL